MAINSHSCSTIHHSLTIHHFTTTPYRKFPHSCWKTPPKTTPYFCNTHHFLYPLLFGQPPQRRHISATPNNQHATCAPPPTTNHPHTSILPLSLARLLSLAPTPILSRAPFSLLVAPTSHLPEL